MKLFLKTFANGRPRLASTLGNSAKREAGGRCLRRNCRSFRRTGRLGGVPLNPKPADPMKIDKKERGEVPKTSGLNSFPKGPYIQLLGNYAPKYRTIVGIMGPNSLMVAYVHPPGKYGFRVLGPAAQQGLHGLESEFWV